MRKPISLFFTLSALIFLLIGCSKQAENTFVHEEMTVSLNLTGDFDVDVTQLLPGSKVDEDLYLISKDGKKYDLDDADVIAEVANKDVSIVDGHDNGNANGTIISILFIDDHYVVTVRTEEEEDYVLDTVDTWNEGDLVSVIIKPEAIKLTLKGDISKYEVQ